MKRARYNGRLIEAGPDAPKRAVCPHCGAEVLLRRRKKFDGESWYWRHETGSSLECPGRSRAPGVRFEHRGTLEVMLRDMVREHGYDVQRVGRGDVSWFHFTPAAAGEVASEFSVLASDLEGMAREEMAGFIRSEIARVEEERRQKLALLDALGLTERDLVWSGRGRREQEKPKSKRPRMAREKSIQRAARAHGYKAHVGEDSVWFEPVGVEDEWIREAMRFVIHRGPGEWPESRWRKEIEVQAARRRKAVKEVNDGV